MATIFLSACAQYSDQLQTNNPEDKQRPRVGVLYVSHGGFETYGAVSYTHLTLPTNREV